MDKLLKWPGSYGQICDATPLQEPVPIPGFQVRTFGEASFSEASLAAITANRKILVPELKKRLATVDLLRKPAVPPEDPSIPKEQQDVTPIGVDPQSLSCLLLEMVVQTKATEVLPELLALEAALLEKTEAAKKDAKAPVPQIDGLDGAGIFPQRKLDESMREAEEAEKKQKDGEVPEEKPLTPEEEARMEREHEVFVAEAAHRDVLGVIVHLLRFAGVEAVLKSELEKKYGAGIKARAAEDEELKKIRKREDIPEADKRWIKWDNLHKVARRTWEVVDIPYTPEVRAQIRGWAEQWIKDNPDGKLKP